MCAEAGFAFAFAVLFTLHGDGRGSEVFCECVIAMRSEVLERLRRLLVDVEEASATLKAVGVVAVGECLRVVVERVIVRVQATDSDEALMYGEVGHRRYA